MFWCPLCNTVIKNSLPGNRTATDVKEGFTHRHASGSARRQSMRKISKTSFDHYILPNKIFCGIAGLWPIDDETSTCRRSLAYFCFVFTFVAACSIFVPEIMMVVASWGDIRTLAGVGPILATVGQLLFRMVYLIARKEQTYKVYHEIRNLWDSSDDPIERQPYEKLAYYARTSTIIFFSACMCNVTTFSIAAAVDYFKISYNASDAYKSRHLPFDVWYGADISPSPYFEIAFVCQVVATAHCGGVISGLDGTVMALIMHVSGQFKLIAVWINKIGMKITSEPCYLPKVEEDLIRQMFLFYLYRYTCNYIVLCQCLPLVLTTGLLFYSVVNDVNNLLTPMIFMQLLTSGVEICLTGFAMMSYAAGTDQLRFISCFASLAVQLLLMCWPGEILVENSQEVGHVAYLNIPWYNLPLNYQKQFCLLIIRAQQYCSISALTFNTLSIRTLTTVFNTAMSFFTLLREIQQK